MAGKSSSAALRKMRSVCREMVLSERLGLLALCRCSVHPVCMDHVRGKVPACPCRTVSGTAAGAGLWIWVTPTACLQGQLVPMVWATGQVDFSTGIVLPVAIISMCSFVLFPPLIVKKSPGLDDNQMCYHKQAVVS